MSKEEILKIQTCVLKVNIHCDGCERKVRKILQKIDGVYKTSIDSELGKVTVLGNVDPATLIKKLGKNDKHAEVWGAASKNNQNQFKNNQVAGGKGGAIKGQKGGNNHPKGGGGGGGQNQQHQLKALQDLKLPQFKGMKFPFGGKDNQNQKAVKFNLPPDDPSDDDYYDDDEFDDYDEFDDELDYDDDDATHVPLNKMKLGNGQQMGNMMLNGQQHQQFMNALAKGGGGGGGGGNGKKGGGVGGNIPVQVNDGKNGGGGKKGGGGNGNSNNQNQGGGGAGKNGGKNGGGGNGNGIGAKKGGGNGMNDGVQGMLNAYNAMGGGNAAAPMGKMNMGQVGQLGGNMPIGQMGQMPAVQGLPMAGAGGGGVGGYFSGAGPEIMAGNPYYQQQQLAAAMMNQQRANGNERFQPMMYARPPPAVNYMPPYPYPYPSPPPADPYTHAFSDENTSSCSVM